jgi:hypothetical protein
VSYISRAYALFGLLTETYPPFTDDHARQIGEPPAPAAPLAPTAPESVGGFAPPVAPPPRDEE